MAKTPKQSYTAALAAVKRKPRHQQAKEIGDQWRTPDWLYWAINTLTGGRIALDLFTDGQNAKAAHYFTAETNALKQDWAAALLDIEMDEGGKPIAYANPPYSVAQDENGDPLTGMSRIMAKAAEERDRGAASTWLVKSATSENWWPAKPFGEEEGVQADAIIFIKGRIAFEPPVWYRPDEGVSPPTSAGFGAAILVFDKNIDPELKKLDGKYLGRAWLQAIGEPLAASAASDRLAWIESFDEADEAPEKGPFYWVHAEGCDCGVVDTFEDLDEILADGADRVPHDVFLKWKAKFDEDEL